MQSHAFCCSPSLWEYGGMCADLHRSSDVESFTTSILVRQSINQSVNHLFRNFLTDASKSDDVLCNNNNNNNNDHLRDEWWWSENTMRNKPSLPSLSLLFLTPSFSFFRQNGMMMGSRQTVSHALPHAYLTLSTPWSSPVEVQQRTRFFLWRGKGLSVSDQNAFFFLVWIHPLKI